MKKNILLVQSLVLLPLFAATPLFSMVHVNYKEKQTSQGKNRKERRQEERAHKKGFASPQQQQQKKFAYTTKEQQPVTEETIQQKKQEHIATFQNPLLQDLQKSTLFMHQSQLNNNITHENHVNVIENPLYNPETQTATSNLVESEVETINLPAPEHRTHNNTNNDQINPLLTSVILPTAEKELSWSEKFNYYTSTSNQILQQILSDLETGAFDVRYKTSFDLLEEAITTATKNNDVQALAKIAALCQQKYEIWIRISDKVAQPASELLRSHYSKELALANNTLEQKLEKRTKEWNLETVACMTSIISTIATYQENMKKMHENYNTSLEQENKRITDLRRDVSTFSCLNKTIRPATADLLTNNQLKTPKNDVHSCIMSVSEKKLNDVMESVKLISSIKGLQIKPQYAEELNQKCLTNK
jgi:hypothetical protein